MSGQYDKSSTRNPNWKGGISKVKSADEILLLDDNTIELISGRFHNLVDSRLDSDCWFWTGGVFKCNGRARFCLGVGLLASRVSYVLHKGSTNGLCVLHTCDNVLCVNPGHLWLGTNADNTADMVSKGRQAPQHGSLNPCAILTEDVVSVIKQRIRNGERQNKIARDLGISKATVNNIAVGKSWRHVK